MASEDTHISGDGLFNLFEGATLGVTSANGIQRMELIQEMSEPSVSRTYHGICKLCVLRDK